MAGAALPARRLVSQQLVRPGFATPAELVAWLGAVQAQDLAAARWAVGLRLADPAITDAGVARALDDGAVLRVHAMRWTWQLVTPADVHWMLALVRPRLTARAAPRLRQLGLDARTLRRSHQLLERALRDGGHRTRAELAAALAAGGVDPAGQRLSHLLGHAELEGLLVSGARRGAQATYALLEHRAPDPGTFTDRRDALAELARRYFHSRGPATVRDFVWWSGLTVADARAGLEAAQPGLVAETIAGDTLWRSRGAPAPAGPAAALLLPAFDEYLVGYRDRSAVLDPTHARRVNAGGGMLDPCVVVAGRVVGTWRRTLGPATVTVELAPFAPLAPPAARAVAAAARRYAGFVGRTLARAR